MDSQMHLPCFKKIHDLDMMHLKIIIKIYNYVLTQGCGNKYFLMFALNVNGGGVGGGGLAPFVRITVACTLAICLCVIKVLLSFIESPCSLKP